MTRRLCGLLLSAGLCLAGSGTLAAPPTPASTKPLRTDKDVRDYLLSFGGTERPLPTYLEAMLSSYRCFRVGIGACDNASTACLRACLGERPCQAACLAGERSCVNPQEPGEQRSQAFTHACWAQCPASEDSC